MTENKKKYNQAEYNKRWIEKSPENRAKSNYSKSKSSAKSFLNNKATKEDLEFFREFINEKLEVLNDIK